MNWQSMDNAPKDGTVILAELDEEGIKHIASIAYWNVDMLRKVDEFSEWKKDDEYWSHVHVDAACEPVRWMEGFPMPKQITFDQS